MIEIHDDGVAWHGYMFEIIGTKVKLFGGIGMQDSTATIDTLQELPEDLRNVMLLCVAMPVAADMMFHIKVSWRTKGVDICHYTDRLGKERWALSFDKTHTITELLQEPK